MRTKPPLGGDFGFPIGAGIATLVTTITVAAGTTTHPWLALVALTAVSMAAAAVTTLWAALATTAVCWALHTGFVINRYGELTFTGRSGRTAALLAAAALVTFAFVAVIRRSRVDTPPASPASRDTLAILGALGRRDEGEPGCVDGVVRDDRSGRPRRSAAPATR